MSANRNSPMCQKIVPDMTDDADYQTWIESLVKYCRCQNGDVPCDGLLAGGICDEMPAYDNDYYEDDDVRSG